ncbi:hypothetical protein LZD49_22270 [Dyadobacter sp. CY261]|uniref:hypothetical protein n=1 Tax=Dyadobacter sp. CY261 TaxID=2907203 RepID=UPI001F2D12C1|nr:hypothetical protein [Dyadobacter sp. CY261]MCF0073222.1 hypothetical protein [Dyadobacter sp. CY261]
MANAVRGKVEMRRLSTIIFLLALVHLLLGVGSTYAQKQVPDIIVVKCAADNERVSADWVNVLKSRSFQRPDSTLHFRQELTGADTKWLRLIESRRLEWEFMLDSLAKPFGAILSSKVVVLVGTGGEDDAFTYGEDVIGLDLSVLGKSYGSAELPENTNRIDRLFAHEMTHLFHKAWMKSRHLELRSFKDSVLWECVYEGLGTYRSLSKKWLPEGDSFRLLPKKPLKRCCRNF